MTGASFFYPTSLNVAEICELTGATVTSRKKIDSETHKFRILSAAPITEAVPGSITFLGKAKFLKNLPHTKASAIFCNEKHAGQVPPSTLALIHPKPYEAFGKVLGMMYPTAMRPQPVSDETGVSERAFLGKNVVLEADVLIEPNSVIGDGVSIGRGSHILAGAVIGKNVQIGRNTTIGSNASVSCTLIGNDVIIHNGTQIGQDGFGFAMGPGGHVKIPQIGRVIIQDDVEIGANCTIDRGANGDTVIGEGTKIDNMVHIAHNCVVGRHCVLIALSGLAGSVILGDYVVIAAQVGVVGHLTVGTGAQIGGGSGVVDHVAPGEKVMGYPAIPAKMWMKEAAKKRLAARKETKKSGMRQGNE